MGGTDAEIRSGAREQEVHGMGKVEERVEQEAQGDGYCRGSRK